MLVSAFVSVYVYIDKMGKTVIVVSKCLFWSTEKLCGTELNERRCSLVIETVDPKMKSLLVYTQCNEVDRYGKKEAGTGEHLTHVNNKINKHKWKAAAPHGRLLHTKHKLKFQAWSSLVFHCCHSSFNPSEAPPWDSRPVSGAGVVHYQLLHRPRSVPTALGPAPLVTCPHRPSQAGGYSRDCALLPPSPGGAVRAAAAYLGVRTDEAREKEMEGWGVTEKREGREEKN